MEPRPALRLGALLFEGFELLDLFGPLETLSGLAPSTSRIVLTAQAAGGQSSAQGPASVVEIPLGKLGEVDVTGPPDRPPRHAVGPRAGAARRHRP